MIQLLETGAYLVNGSELIADNAEAIAAIKAKTGKEVRKEDAAKETIAYHILKEHNTSDNMDKLKIKFDKLTSHDITFVGIIQTARASGLTKFPVPYVLTNCHNSLCAVGGTINEDDHMFGLTCAKKYGGVYVPPHQAVIHQYAREMLAGGGRMILGSDSHTRYGALGTMAMGEGGPELVKQLLNQTYDINMPGIVAVYLEGAPVKGVGPQDVALAIIGAVFKNGYVKNKVMEFVGPGVASLSARWWGPAPPISAASTGRPAPSATRSTASPPPGPWPTPGSRCSTASTRHLRPTVRSIPPMPFCWWIPTTPSKAASRTRSGPSTRS